MMPKSKSFKDHASDQATLMVMNCFDRNKEAGSALVAVFAMIGIGLIFFGAYSQTSISMKSLQGKSRSSFEQSLEQENSFASLAALLRKSKIILENGTNLVIDSSTRKTVKLVSASNASMQISRSNPLVLNVSTCSSDVYQRTTLDLNALHNGAAFNGGCSKSRVAETVTHKAKIVEFDSDGWLRVTVASASGSEREARMQMGNPKLIDLTMNGTTTTKTNYEHYVLVGDPFTFSWGSQNAFQCSYTLKDIHGADQSSLISNIVKNNAGLTKVSFTVNKMPNKNLTLDLTCYGSYGTIPQNFKMTVYSHTTCWGVGGPKQYAYIFPDQKRASVCYGNVASGAGSGAWGAPKIADCGTFAKIAPVTCGADSNFAGIVAIGAPWCTCVNGEKVTIPGHPWN